MAGSGVGLKSSHLWTSPCAPSVLAPRGLAADRMQHSPATEREKHPLAQRQEMMCGRHHDEYPWHAARQPSLTIYDGTSALLGSAWRCPIITIRHGHGPTTASRSAAHRFIYIDRLRGAVKQNQSSKRADRKANCPAQFHPAGETGTGAQRPERRGLAHCSGGRRTP